MRVQADLTEAQLLFNGLGWNKPPAAPRRCMLDVVPKPDGSTDLENLKILGDDINVQGGVALDAEQRLKEFYFSDFSVNSLTHVEITATVRDDQVLEIEAEGPSYDGKQFFQSLFSAGQLMPRRARRPVRHRPDRADRHGRGLLRHDHQGRRGDAEEAQWPARRARCQGRAERQGSGRGTLAQNSSGARVISAEARDAGDAFRLIGFYPRSRAAKRR